MLLNLEELLKRAESSLNQAMQLPPQKVVLTVKDNKRQLIRIICEELVQDQEFQKKHTSDNKLLLTSDNDIPVELNKRKVIQRVDMKTTHEEADNIIVQQMVAAANKNQKGISVYLMIQMCLCFIFTIIS